MHFSQTSATSWRGYLFSLHHEIISSQYCIIMKCFFRRKKKSGKNLGTSGIKVIGVGCGGCNIVNHMAENGFNLGSLAVCDMDAEVVERAKVQEKLLLGSSGLGAGNDPKTARQEAMKQIKDIRAMLLDTKVVFIVSCLGGGTGSGVTPIIAREAYNKGTSTFAMVTLPFEFEGEHKFRQALGGVHLMEHVTDGIFFLNNQFLKRHGQDKLMNRALEDTNSLIQGVIQSLINSTCYD